MRCDREPRLVVAPRARLRRALAGLVCGLGLTVAACGTPSGPSTGAHATPTPTPAATATPVYPALTTPLVTFTGQSKSVTSAAWSPDDKQVASGADGGTVQVWDAATARTLWTASPVPYVFAVAWSPDGTHIISGADDKLARIWNAATGQTTLVYRGQTDVVWAAVWSPDSSEVVSCSQDGTAQVWRPVAG